MLDRLQHIMNNTQDPDSLSLIEKVKRKAKMYNSEILIDGQYKQVNLESHLIMFDTQMFIKDIKTNLMLGFFLVTFENGEFIHYDYEGKAYLSLDPESKLYKLRLSRYDIKQIV